MPICIECCYPVSQLYHVLHSGNPKSAAHTPKTPVPNLAGASSSHKSNLATQKASESRDKNKTGGIGSDVRLTQCPRCKRFADKYVEHDFVVLFIDLVLVKPQVSGHGSYGDDIVKILPRRKSFCLLKVLRNVALLKICLQTRYTAICSSTVSPAMTTN